MATTAIIFIGRTEVLIFKRSREVHTEQRREERNPEWGGGPSALPVARGLLQVPPLTAVTPGA